MLFSNWFYSFYCLPQYMCVKSHQLMPTSIILLNSLRKFVGCQWFLVGYPLCGSWYRSKVSFKCTRVLWTDLNRNRIKIFGSYLFIGLKVPGNRLWKLSRIIYVLEYFCFFVEVRFFLYQTEKGGILVILFWITYSFHLKTIAIKFENNLE